MGRRHLLHWQTRRTSAGSFLLPFFGFAAADDRFPGLHAADRFVKGLGRPGTLKAEQQFELVRVHGVQAVRRPVALALCQSTTSLTKPSARKSAHKRDG